MVAVLRILERLARRPTGPFHEHGVLREVRAIARESGARALADDHGNLVVRPPGRRRGPPVWLVAHTDHPAFEATGPDEAVFLGGMAPGYYRRGARIRFHHDGESRVSTIQRMRKRAGSIHVTLKHRGSLTKGDLGVWSVTDYRTAGGLVHARQLDDLAGSAVSLAVVARAVRSGENVTALLTRAEEVGFVGTMAAIRGGLVPLDAWIVNLEASKAIPGVTVGGGPVIRVGDRARTFDAGAESLLAAARSKMRLPVQRALMSGGVCEATPWNAFGYRATGVAIPLKNYHNMGPDNQVRAEAVAAKDLTTAVDLVLKAARFAPKSEAWEERLRARITKRTGRHLERLRRTSTTDS